MNQADHEIVSPVMIPSQAEQAVISQVTEAQGAQVSVISPLVTELGLNTVIAQMRADWCKSNEFPVIRRYLLMPEILISSVNVKEYLDRWLKGDTLSSIAINLQSSMVSLASQVKDNESMMPVQSLMRELDHRLTKRVNVFLKEHLGLKTWDISSFIDDYPSLSRILLRKQGETYSNALAEWESNLLKLLASEFMVDMLVYNTFKELLELSPGVHMWHLPNTYTITLFPFDRAVLNIPFNDEPFPLVSSQHRLLYDAVSNLFEEGDGESQFGGLVPENNVIVTKDGVRYYVRQNVDKKGLYLKKY